MERVVQGYQVARSGVFSNSPLCCSAEGECVAWQVQRRVQGGELVGLVSPGLTCLHRAPGALVGVGFLKVSSCFQ